VGAQLALLLLIYNNYDPLFQLPESFYRPLPILRVILLPFGYSPLPPFERPPDEAMLAAYWITLVSGGFAFVGLLTNVSLSLFAFGNIFLQAFRYSFHDYHHSEALMMLCLCLLALSPAGKALSLDDLFARLRETTRRRAFEPFRLIHETHTFARWPLLLTGMLLSIVYLDAAVKKLEASGLDWMNGYTLQYYLVALGGGDRGSEIATWLGQHHTVVVLLSWTTILWEGTFFLILIFGNLIWLYLPLGLALHVGMCVTNLACFYQLMVLYTVFVPWSRIVMRASQALQGNRSSKVQIVYDGGCILCVRSMTVVRYLDWFDRLDYVDIRSWRSGATATAGVGDFDIRGADMLAIRPDGVSRAGFFAWREIVLRLPVLWPLLLLFYFPGASLAGPKVYRAIASSRARFADCEGTCSLQH
jgi:predicted DCC family thiol-disulfide oxidoreductase YuxK